MANKQATELIRLYQFQKLNLSAIARQLNENGFRTRKGAFFKAETVKRLVVQQKNGGEKKDRNRRVADGPMACPFRSFADSSTLDCTGIQTEPGFVGLYT
ncbi:recombinase family protein [Larkinella knui]|uniref:recombinase family protein n=1 Tax=Larkinella knui TaxID=2025310 RepID=UPI00286D6F27|nr:recombinase family protein [Larkinella knui]